MWLIRRIPKPLYNLEGNSGYMFPVYVCCRSRSTLRNIKGEGRGEEGVDTVRRGSVTVMHVKLVHTVKCGESRFRMNGRAMQRRRESTIFAKLVYVLNVCMH